MVAGCASNNESSKSCNWAGVTASPICSLSARASVCNRTGWWWLLMSSGSANETSAEELFSSTKARFNSLLASARIGTCCVSVL